MDCIAHRGFAGVAPENTLAAVRDAVAVADGIEVDVRRCRSGELVVCHDERVDRVTDGAGLVADFTAAELADLSVEGSGEGVPTLADVLAAVPEEVTCHAELKERGLDADLAALAADAACPVVAGSFDADPLDGLALPTAFLTDGADGVVARAASLGCVAVHPRVDACDRTLVETAHREGLAVNAWTVTTPAETRRLRAVGVDGVIADFPGCCPSRV